MQIVSPDLVKSKKVLLRLDIDVSIENGKVVDDFRLLAGLDTLELCLHNAEQVIVMGHIGRPNGKEFSKLSVGPIVEWLEDHLDCHWEDGKLKVMENLRFEEGEDAGNLKFAQELASYGNFYVNESFAAYRPSASTTILPTLLPHAAGLNFAEEVEELGKVINHPKKPLVAIMGGAKVEDKLPVIEKMAKIADVVLVGGKLSQEIKDNNILLPNNVMVGKMREDGLDLATETVDSWKPLIANCQMVVWNGPVGKIEETGVVSNQIIKDENELGSEKGSYQIAQMIISSQSENIIGGGDTVAFLNKHGLLQKFHFVSTGGGAMLKFLADGTLPTIEVLK